MGRISFSSGKDSLAYPTKTIYDKTVQYYLEEERDGQFDVTRLQINAGKPLNLAGHTVYICTVSWFGHNDVIRISNGNITMYSEEKSRKEIIAEIDLAQMEKNLEYRRFVMQVLLDRKRVEEIYAQSFKENKSTSQKNGGYVGSVIYNPETKKYLTIRRDDVGKAAFNLEEIQARRDAYRNKSMRETMKKVRELQERKAATAGEKAAIAEEEAALQKRLEQLSKE